MYLCPLLDFNGNITVFLMNNFYLDGKIGVEIIFSDWYRISRHFMNFTSWCILECGSEVIFCGSLVSPSGCDGGFKVFGYQL